MSPCDCYASNLVGDHEEYEHDSDGGKLDEIHSAEVMRMMDVGSSAWSEPLVEVPVPANRIRHNFRVKFFLSEKESGGQYGFLTPLEEGLPETHVWYKNIENQEFNPARILVKGQLVSACIEDESGRPRAVKVKLLEAQPPETESEFIRLTKNAMMKRSP